MGHWHHRDVAPRTERGDRAGAVGPGPQRHRPAGPGSAPRPRQPRATMTSDSRVMPPLATRLPEPRTDHAGPGWIVVWAFYAFVFSIPFEFPDRDFPIEIPTAVGALFLLTTIVQPRTNFGK